MVSYLQSYKFLYKLRASVSGGIPIFCPLLLKKASISLLEVQNFILQGFFADTGVPQEGVSPAVVGKKECLGGISMVRADLSHRIIPRLRWLIFSSGVFPCKKNLNR